MFDISWSEFLLIGVVALVFIGPKELPAVMRTIGQWTRRLRSMAADFQNQFQEAIREAEMADLKKQVDEMTQGVKDYDPLKDVKSDFEVAATEVKTAVEAPVGASVETTVETSSAPNSAAADAPITLPSAPEQAPAARSDHASSPETPAIAKPDSEGHSG
jgi:sec-independent protein translocase protein TatB